MSILSNSSLLKQIIKCLQPSNERFLATAYIIVKLQPVQFNKRCLPTWQIIARGHFFLDFMWIIIHYGITSAQTNQIMTTAYIIVKLKPEKFNKK